MPAGTEASPTGNCTALLLQEVPSSDYLSDQSGMRSAIIVVEQRPKEVVSLYRTRVRIPGSEVSRNALIAQGAWPDDIAKRWWLADQTGRRLSVRTVEQQPKRVVSLPDEVTVLDRLLGLVSSHRALVLSHLSLILTPKLYRKRGFLGTTDDLWPHGRDTHPANWSRCTGFRVAGHYTECLPQLSNRGGGYQPRNCRGF